MYLLTSQQLNVTFLHDVDEVLLSIVKQKWDGN